MMKNALKIFLFMTVLTGLVYPLLTTLIAQILMPHFSNGSLIKKDDRIIGSSLIAQNNEEIHYFWPRPSAIDYNPIKPSGGSNLGPTSKKLKGVIKQRKKRFGEKAPAELLFASGSGLDPHISVEVAYFQIERVAGARSMKKEELKNLIDSLVEGKQLGFIGSRYINVLILNRALDER